MNELRVMLRIAALIVAPMLPAASVGFWVGAPAKWTEAVVGILLGLPVAAILSWFVYRGWRRWIRLLRVLMIVAQVVVLLGMGGLIRVMAEEVGEGECAHLHECVLRSLKQFFADV
jgi:hypothetical protein